MCILTLAYKLFVDSDDLQPIALADHTYNAGRQAVAATFTADNSISILPGLLAWASSQCL